MSARDAATTYFNAGFTPIPCVPKKKIPACKHKPWLEGLSPEKIEAHYEKYPDHEVGIITSKDLVVFDADAPESIAALYQLEESFDLVPNMVNKTAKGEHHFFQVAETAYVKSDSHPSKEHPERIDLKTDKGIVLMPPSTGKEVKLCEVERADELTEAHQQFIDAVFHHNGRPVPRKAVSTPRSSIPVDLSNQKLKELSALANPLDPDCGYEDWTGVGMALNHETGSSDEGLTIWADWSSTGKDYPGYDVLKYKWDSFGNFKGHPFTKASLCNWVEKAGHDWLSILDRLQPQFEICEHKVIDPTPTQAKAVSEKSPIGFDRYSLRGKSNELRKEVQAQKFVLNQVALLGQLTVLYAQYNCGKTLLVLHLLIEGINNGQIDPSDIYFFNLDDDFPGLVSKNELAEEAGFHMICEGFEGFKVSNFTVDIEKLIEQDQAKGKILILDTVKKFIDLMDKRATAKWDRLMRQFVAKGGTIIGLAHVNKNLGADGKPVHSGTSDLIDDSDCAFVVSIAQENPNTQIRTIELENKKRRGSVARTVAFEYSIEDGLTYDQLLASVKPVDAAELGAIKQAENGKPEVETIQAISDCISDGTNLKMQIRDEVNSQTKVSKRKVLTILEEYTGDDPELHHWNFETREHGRKVYFLLP
jgi:hypothetical protein